MEVISKRRPNNNSGFYISISISKTFKSKLNTASWFQNCFQLEMLQEISCCPESWFYSQQFTIGDQQVKTWYLYIISNHIVQKREGKYSILSACHNLFLEGVIKMYLHFLKSIYRHLCPNTWAVFIFRFPVMQRERKLKLIVLHNSILKLYRDLENIFCQEIRMLYILTWSSLRIPDIVSTVTRLWYNVNIITSVLKKMVIGFQSSWPPPLKKHSEHHYVVYFKVAFTGSS